eukprot:COSAG04_NODE_1614_length_6164_cov_66.962737_2_plen_200_part_00
MAEVAAPPIWTNEMMDHLDHHDARTGQQQQRAGEREGEPQQQPDKQEAEPQQDYKRLRQDAEAAQEAAGAEGPDAEAEEAEPPAAAEAEEAEEAPRTAANHWGWKTWSDTITDGDNHTTHAAICGPDGLVWTSSATSDAWRHGRVGDPGGGAVVVRFLRRRDVGGLETTCAMCSRDTRVSLTYPSGSHQRCCSALPLRS